MTIFQFEDAVIDEAELAPPAGLTVKCSWCGEIILVDGNELALAMCQTCFQGLLEEFQRTQLAGTPSARPSDH